MPLVLIYTTVARIMGVEGISMEPTLYDKDYVFVTIRDVCPAAAGGYRNAAQGKIHDDSLGETCKSDGRAKR
jgi:hypothetical protein